MSRCLKSCITTTFLISLMGHWVQPALAQAQPVITPPTFSLPHGLLSAPVQLILRSSTPGAIIRYTTDFSTPTPTTGLSYSAPITISKTTVVRAMVITPQGRSATLTQSYIFPAQVRSQTNNPGPGWPDKFSGDTREGSNYLAYYEMAPEIAALHSPAELEAALRAIPTISLVTDMPNLWDEKKGIYYNPLESGSDWERPISIEWIDPSGATPGFTENAGVRIHGQASRHPYRTPKKTFRVVFSKDYGNGKLDYNLFPKTQAVSKFDRLLVRHGGNRSFPYVVAELRRIADYVNDEWARRAFLDMGGLAGHGSYAHLYLNGLYWGLYNVTERMDTRFIADYQGGKDEDYDLIDPAEENKYAPTAESGDLKAWNELHALLAATPISNATYEQVKTRLNLADLTDYMILLHYIGNNDWPKHNWYAYRKRIGSDTRFHFIPWDSDVSLYQLEANRTLADAEGSPARLFLRLVTHPEYRQLVSDRLYRHMVQASGSLTPAACTTRYQALVTTIDQAIIGESVRWGAYAEKIYPSIKSILEESKLPSYFHTRNATGENLDPTKDTTSGFRRNWVQIRDTRLNDYCPKRTGVVLQQYQTNGWYQNTVKAPSFSQDGGSVSSGTRITIGNSGSGEVYYTTDGSDPRQAGGGVAAGATKGGATASVTIGGTTTLRARVLSGTTWSPLHEATFRVGGGN